MEGEGSGVSLLNQTSLRHHLDLSVKVKSIMALGHPRHLRKNNLLSPRMKMVYFIQ